MWLLEILLSPPFLLSFNFKSFWYSWKKKTLDLRRSGFVIWSSKETICKETTFDVSFWPKQEHNTLRSGKENKRKKEKTYTQIYLCSNTKLGPKIYRNLGFGEKGLNFEEPYRRREKRGKERIWRKEGIGNVRIFETKCNPLSSIELITQFIINIFTDTQNEYFGPSLVSLQCLHQYTQVFLTSK